MIQIRVRGPVGNKQPGEGVNLSQPLLRLVEDRAQEEEVDLYEGIRLDWNLLVAFDRISKVKLPGSEAIGPFPTKLPCHHYLQKAIPTRDPIIAHPCLQKSKPQHARSTIRNRLTLN